MENVHEKYIRRCIELGMEAKANRATPVGAVVVYSDQIIAEGFEGEVYLPSPIAHAEIIAMLKAIQHFGSKDLNNCILYSTKEPCFMCSYLIRQTGIQGLIFASRTEETGGVSSVFPLLLSDKIKKWASPPFIIEGVLKNDCEQLLK